MSDAPPQSALRDLRAHLVHPATLAALAGVSSALALIGPFGTDEALRPLPRLFYWVATAGLTYGMGSLVAALARSRLSRGLPPLAADIVTGLCVGVALVPVVLALNVALLDHVPDDLPRFAATLVSLGAIITVTLSRCG